MKKDFNYPTEDVIPHITGLPCDCVDCVKHTAYTKQLHDRNAVYVNAFDFPSFDRHGRSAINLVDHADTAPNVGDFVKSTVDHPLYHKAGDKPFKVAKASTSNSNLGRFKSFNSSKNWIITTDPIYGDVWIPYTHPEQFYFKPYDSTKAELTNKQKTGIALGVIGKAAPGGQVVEAGAKTVEKGVEAVGSVIDTLSGYTKWIIILLVVAIAGGVFLRLRGQK